ncbi:MAG: hypothetical protein DRI70_04985 [Bacteroidetes bacterium]|nr:MAG: hypothetical protein DRI70_04985 [Bacteroidota bacterium]
MLGVEIRIPGKLPKKATNYEKQKARKYFKARAGIEPVIGHIKHDHRMIKEETIDWCQYLLGPSMVHYMNIKIYSRENRWIFQV